MPNRGRRLFFALWPDAATRDALETLLSPLVAGVSGKPVPRANLHVTLVFIGAFPEDRLAELARAAAAIEARLIRLRFDRFSYWQRPRVGCLCAAEVPPALRRLVAELDGVAGRFGVQTERREYRPHVTAAREVSAFETVYLPRPVEFTWRGFELIESVPGEAGSRYLPVKEARDHDSP